MSSSSVALFIYLNEKLKPFLVQYSYKTLSILIHPIEEQSNFQYIHIVLEVQYILKTIRKLRLLTDWSLESLFIVQQMVCKVDYIGTSVHFQLIKTIIITQTRKKVTNFDQSRKRQLLCLLIQYQNIHPDQASNYMLTCITRQLSNQLISIRKRKMRVHIGS